MCRHRCTYNRAWGEWLFIVVHAPTRENDDDDDEEMKVFVNLGTTSLATREDAHFFFGVLSSMFSDFLFLAVVNWTLVGIFFFPAPFSSSPPCIYHEPGKQESKTPVQGRRERERKRKFFFFLIMIFDIFMHPLRQRENEVEAKSIFLLRLFYLFVNLVRFLLRLYDIQIAPTSIPSRSRSLCLSLLHIQCSPWTDRATFQCICPWHNRFSFSFLSQQLWQTNFS